SPITQSFSQSAPDFGDFDATFDAHAEVNDPNPPNGAANVDAHAEIHSLLLPNKIIDNGSVKLNAGLGVDDMGHPLGDLTGFTHVDFTVSFRTTQRQSYVLDYTTFTAFANATPTFTDAAGQPVPGHLVIEGDTFFGEFRWDG